MRTSHLNRTDSRGPSDVQASHKGTRPLALGYVQRGLLASDEQVSEVKTDLSRFASDSGFSLSSIFVEQPGTWLQAFEELVEAAAQEQAHAVLLPNPLHLAVLGVPADIKWIFQRATGARLLVVRSAPQSRWADVPEPCFPRPPAVPSKPSANSPGR